MIGKLQNSKGKTKCKFHQNVTILMMKRFLEDKDYEE